MIFDRTIDDVINAAEIIKEKVNKYLPLTIDDLETLERGTCTINTINRVVDKVKELKELLADIGYYNVSSSSKRRAYGEFFINADLIELFDNVKEVRDAFFVYDETPEVPSPEYFYENINSIEKVLFDVENMISAVKESYLECGTFECGEY